MNFTKHRQQEQGEEGQLMQALWSMWKTVDCLHFLFSLPDRTEEGSWSHHPLLCQMLQGALTSPQLKEWLLFGLSKPINKWHIFGESYWARSVHMIQSGSIRVAERSSVCRGWKNIHCLFSTVPLSSGKNPPLDEARAE